MGHNRTQLAHSPQPHLVVVHQRVVAVAQHVHVRRLERVVLGEGEAHAVGRGVVAAVGGAADAQVDVPRASLGVGVGHHASLHIH
jgi:hypothetical protein